jgi:hypothetical protein
MVKQISIVLEIQDYENEMEVLAKIKEFISTLKRPCPSPKIVGFHVKLLKEWEKNH